MTSERAERQERARRLRRARLLRLLIVVLCLPFVGLVFQLIASAVDARAFPPPGQMVDVGGFRLHLHCQGAGSPTVLLDAGMGDNALHWSLVAAPIAEITRVCAYDRAGLGWSDPGPGPRTSERIASELTALLDSAGVVDPLVVVGHSFGAFNVRLFAAEQRERVAGVVLVDGADPQFWMSKQGWEQARAARTERRRQGWAARIGLVRFYAALVRLGIVQEPAAISGFLAAMPREVGKAQLALWSRPAYYFATASQWDAMVASAASVVRAGDLGSVPLVVVTAADNDTGAQRKAARLSTRGRQIIAEGSGHDVHIERPGYVIDAIRDLVVAARRRR